MQMIAPIYLVILPENKRNTTSQMSIAAIFQIIDYWMTVKN